MEWRSVKALLDVAPFGAAQAEVLEALLLYHLGDVANSLKPALQPLATVLDEEGGLAAKEEVLLGR